jgi:hypothetical protein
MATSICSRDTTNRPPARKWWWVDCVPIVVPARTVLQKLPDVLLLVPFVPNYQIYFTGWTKYDIVFYSPVCKPMSSYLETTSNPKFLRDSISSPSHQITSPQLAPQVVVHSPKDLQDILSISNRFCFVSATASFTTSPGLLRSCPPAEHSRPVTPQPPSTLKPVHRQT